MELEPGTVVGDRYVVEGRLGRGGMAVVYRVRHLQRGTRHALKVLSVTSRPVHERLLREGRIQAGLGHVNVVSVAEVLSVSGQPALVLELVRGPPLSLLLRHAELTLKELDALIVGILRGMAAAHGAGVVHRDLKPGNVLVAVEEGRLVPRVTDFGLAKALLDDDPGRTRSSATLGTPRYMAPEQVRNSRDVDARADVWALGVLLYELFAGEPPFTQTDQLELYQAIAAGEHVPLRELHPELPERMLATVDAALTVDLELRPASAAALLALWGGEEPALTWSTSLLDVAREIASDSLVSEGDTVMPSPTVGGLTWTPEVAAPQSVAEPPSGPSVPWDRVAVGLGVLLVVLAIGWGLGRWGRGVEVEPGAVSAPAEAAPAEAAPAATEGFGEWLVAEPGERRWFSELRVSQPVVDRARTALIHARFEEAQEQSEYVEATSGLGRMVAVTTLAKQARGYEFSAQLQLYELNRYPDPDDGILRALAPEDRTASLDAWIALNPDDWLARVWRLELSAVGDDPAVRRDHLDVLLAQHGELPLSWWAASREHRRQGRTEEALRAAERGLQLVPANPWMMLERVRTLQARGAMGPALQAVRGVLARSDPPEEAALVLADLLLLSGADEEAAATVDEILDSRRALNLAAALALSHGPLLAEAGRADEAVALAERARAVPLRLKRNVEVARLSLLLASLRSDDAQRAEDLGWARSALGAPEVPSDVGRELAAWLRTLDDDGATD